MSPRKKRERPDESVPQRRPSLVDQLRGAASVFAPFLVVGLLIVVVVLLHALVTREPGPPRAAIVDQLGLTFPNPDFVENATETLEQAGYSVDYYPGEEVTVDFYRGLPSHDYEFIILRSHAGLLENADSGMKSAGAILFTAERYSPAKYPNERRLLRLFKVAYHEDGERYFGVTPAFVESSMKGKFAGATVIMMGCAGLGTDATAHAFVERGAETFISWSDLVSAGHTDAATERLLGHLLIGGLSTEEAVARTMAEVGPDPEFDSVLLSYPPEG